MIIKRNNNYLFYRVAITHIFALLVFLSGKLNFIAIFIIWLVTAIIPNFVLSFTKNLKVIEVKDDKLYLIFSEYFKEVIECYNYFDLNFTYKNEIGAKGSVTKEFRVCKINNGKSVISIGGIFDGWTEDKIYKIIEELNKIGIKIKE